MAKQAEFDLTGSVPIALAPEERERIEAEIQACLDAAHAAIALLDEVAGDPDLEDDGDAEPDNDTEPDLGWPDMVNQTKALKACLGPGAAFDAEQDSADDEPSLGSLGGSYDADRFDQEYWARGLSNECEGDEHDGREPDVDREPSLSLTNDINQERALRHASCGWNTVIEDAEGPDADREPSLGSLTGDQRYWAAGDRRELEEVSEDEGAQCEDEGACEMAREDLW